MECLADDVSSKYHELEPVIKYLEEEMSGVLVLPEGFRYVTADFEKLKALQVRMQADTE